MKHLLTFLIAAMPALVQAIDFSPLDSILEARYPDPTEPGAAVLIAQGDSVLYERYFGTADLADGTKIGADTRFCIASISKQFTVMALLQQASAHRGALPLLDTPVTEFFHYPQPFWHAITLRNLASHTSGVPDSRPRDDRRWCVYADEEQSIEYFPTVEKPTFGAGEYYDYLNPSFILLAKVVEQTSGMNFYDYVRANIFGNAGMNSTYYFDRDNRGDNESHAYVPDGDEWREYDFGEETFYATRPDGGIYSTARDLLRWENALRDGKIVSSDWLRLAYQPEVSVTGSPTCDYQRRPDTWYGLGFFIDHPAGTSRKIYHTGDNGGYQAYLAKYPAEDIKIIVLENRNDRSRDELMAQIDRMLNLR